jgi:hypothetical protein
MVSLDHQSEVCSSPANGVLVPCGYRNIAVGNRLLAANSGRRCFSSISISQGVCLPYRQSTVHDQEMAAFLEKANALAPKYRTELLKDA